MGSVGEGISEVGCLLAVCGPACLFRPVLPLQRPLVIERRVCQSLDICFERNFESVCGHLSLSVSCVRGFEDAIQTAITIGTVVLRPSKTAGR